MAGSLNPTELTFVKPFYLKMMGLNALGVGEDLWAQLVEIGRAATAPDVGWMLRTGHWRPVVMGAWFSLAVPSEAIVDDLLSAMRESKGSLTAPPLAAAATLVAGRAAVPAMTDYIDFIMEPVRRDGSESVVAAAVHHLGEETGIAVSDHARQSFHDLHGVALRLHQTWRDRDLQDATS